MFRDKTFNIAFLISASWHIFCMLCFTIVVLPAGFPMSKISNVSFLGPILEKTAFELMLEKKVKFEQTSYREIMNLKNVFLSNNETGLDKLKFDDSFVKAEEDETKISANDLFGDFKVIPSFVEGSLGAGHGGMQQAPPLYQYGEDMTIEGPLANKEILFRPDPPVIPKRIKSGQESFTVELKFKTSLGGKVEKAVLSVSSGYPDVDIAAINYIKGFQFSAASSTDEREWNKAKLNLKCK